MKTTLVSLKIRKNEVGEDVLLISLDTIGGFVYIELHPYSTNPYGDDGFFNMRITETDEYEYVFNSISYDVTVYTDSFSSKELGLTISYQKETGFMEIKSELNDVQLLLNYDYYILDNGSASPDYESWSYWSEVDYSFVPISRDEIKVLGFISLESLDDIFDFSTRETLGVKEEKTIEIDLSTIEKLQDIYDTMEEHLLVPVGSGNPDCMVQFRIILHDMKERMDGK